MDILNKVAVIIRDSLALEEDFRIDESTTIEQLNADSLDLVEIVMEIESAFSVSIPEGAEEKIHTVGDVVSLIKNSVTK